MGLAERPTHPLRSRSYWRGLLLWTLSSLAFAMLIAPPAAARGKRLPRRCVAVGARAKRPHRSEARCRLTKAAPTPFATTRGGKVTFPAALQAYVENVGPLPGGPRPRRHHLRLRFLDGPIRWLVGYARRLTPAQRRALQAAVTGKGGTLVHPAFASVRWQAVINEALVRLGAHLGVNPGSVKTSLRFSLVPDKDNPEALASQGPTNAAGAYTGTAATCNFEIYPLGAGIDPDSDLGHEIVAHESFHCLASVISGLDLYYGGEPGWLEEGAATWAGLQIAEEWRRAPQDEWWTTYLTTPSVPLNERTYDGVGFFAHLAESGTSPWIVLPAMLRDPGKAYAVAINDKFLDTWGSSFLRRGDFGTAWSTHGPGITKAAHHPKLLDFPNETELTLPVASMKATTIHPDLRGDVFELRVDSGDSAHGRFRAGGSDRLVPLSTQTYCTRPGGCTCPDGSGAELPSLPRGPAWLAVAGPAQVTLRSISRHIFCKTLPPPTAGLPRTCPPPPSASLYSQQLLAIFRDLGVWSQALNHRYPNVVRRTRAAAPWLRCAASRLRRTSPPDPTVAARVSDAETALDNAAGVASSGNQTAFKAAVDEVNLRFSLAVAAAEGYENSNP